VKFDYFEILYKFLIGKDHETIDLNIAE